MSFMGRRNLPTPPSKEGALKAVAVAYLVWVGALTVFLLYLVAATAFSFSRSPEGLITPVAVFGATIPVAAGLGLFALLVLATTAVGFALGAGALGVANTRPKPWMRAATAVLLVLYVFGIVWAFAQSDPVTFLAYALALLLTWGLRAALRQRHLELEEQAGNDQAPEDKDLSADMPPRLVHTITGYCQLMVIWGSMECAMAFAYMAKTAGLTTTGPGFAVEAGSAVLTSVFLLIQGVYFIVNAVFHIRGRSNVRLAYIGVTMSLVGGLVALSLFSVSFLAWLFGAPDGTEQLFYSLMGLGLMGAVYARTDRRLHYLKVAERSA